MSNRGTFDAIDDYGAIAGPFAEAGPANWLAAARAIRDINRYGRAVKWRGEFVFSAPLPPITGKSGGLFGTGSGLGEWPSPSDAGGIGTVFRSNFATGDLLTFSGSWDFEHADIAFWPMMFRTSGAELVITNRADKFLGQRLKFRYCTNPIRVEGIIHATLRDVHSFDTWGEAHLKCVGTAQQNLEGLRLENFSTYQTGTEPDVGLCADWAALSAVTQGHLRKISGWVLIASQGGTTGSTAPTIPSYASAIDPNTVLINDGTVRWSVHSKEGQAGVLIESWTRHILLEAPYLHSNYHALKVVDSAAVSGSEPRYIDAQALKCDHNYGNCIELAAGHITEFTAPKIEGSATGSGVNIGAGVKGHTTITGGFVYAHAKEGIKLCLGSTHTAIIGTHVGSNSRLGANTYNGIQADAAHFTIMGCRPGQGSAIFVGTQKYGIGIGAGADHFIVMGNRCEGGTGGIHNLAGVGPTKICEKNL